MAACWPATEQVERGGWLLRDTPGLDRGRSNAALPLRPHPDLEVLGAFCAGRGRRAQVHVAPADDLRALDAELALRGWAVAMRTDVLVAEPGAIASPEARVALLGAPTPAWLEAWGTAEGREPASVAAHARTVFAALPAGEAAFALAAGGAAVGLGVRAHGVCGLFSMATAPRARRRGHAAAVLGALAAWAAEAGVSTLALQVLADNAPARAFYHRHGFRRAHGYHYRREPPA